MKTKILILSALMVISMFAMAVMPVSASPGATTANEVSSTDAGPTATASSAVTTEGGNITNVDLVADSYTERWAGFYGNVTGTINLTDGTYSLYNWTWTVADEGEVIASTASSGITWASLVNGTATEVDTAWSFSSSSDSATSTFDSTESVTIGDQTMTGTDAADTGAADGYKTAIVKDNTTVTSKDDLLFVANIINGGSTFNSETHDFEMIVPTNATIGQTEQYYFYVELF